MTNFAHYWNQGMSYKEYRQLLTDLLAEGKTTGDNQSPEMIQYAKLNLQRMKRVEKTFRPIDELMALQGQSVKAMHWLVLTEGWCGDAAQTTAAMAAMAELLDGVEIKYLLRDQHLELMDQFLTRGGRAIPLIIFLDADFQLLGRWGARPAVLQSLIDQMRTDGKVSFGQMVEQVHLWYAEDKTISTQKEIAELLNSTV
jgi:hypothetical protein